MKRSSTVVLTRALAQGALAVALALGTAALAPALAADPPEQAAVQKAKAHRSKGELKAAVLELKNALQMNPQNGQARLLLGQIYLELGQGADAEKELRRARELGEEAAALAPLGEALLLQGKYAELLKDIEPSAGLPADVRAQVLALRGDARLGQGDAKAAQDYFAQALALQASQPRALLGQARAAMAEKRWDDARRGVDRALQSDSRNRAARDLLADLELAQGRYKEAEQALTKSIELSPRHAEAQLKRALVRLELNDLDGAEKDIAAVKPVLTKSAGVVYADGVLDFRRGRFEQAAEKLTAFLQVSPNQLQASFYLGVAHYGLGHLEQAEQYLGDVLKKAPQLDEAAVILGTARLRRGDYAGAETVLRPVAERDPNNATALQALGTALVQIGKKEEGKSYLERAVVLRPDYANGRIDLALGQLRLGQREQAIRELEAASALAPESTRADIALVHEYLAAKNFDEAMKAIERLRSKLPNSPEPDILTGMAYAGKGDTEQARAAFERALQIQPGNPAAGNGLAVLAIQAKDLDKAKTYYEDVLKHNPGQEETLMRLATLELQQGNRAAARARIEEAVGKNPKALQPRLALAREQMAEREPLKALSTLNEIKDRYAASADYLAALGDVQIAARENASAVSTLRKLVELKPDSADAHYLLARAYGASKNKAGLRQELFKGLAIDPNRPLSSPVMVQLSNLADNLEEKNKLLAELKKIQPDHPELLDLEAQLALKQKAPEKAVAIYRGLHERFPDEIVWVRLLASAQWQAGDKDGHLATLSQWLEKHPDDMATQYQIANSYLKLERYAEAKTAFNRVLQAAPDNVVALNNLAGMLVRDDPKQARVYAEKAIELAPDNPQVIGTLARVLLEQGETHRAVDLLRGSIGGFNPVPAESIPGLKYHLAVALVKDGHKEEARTTLQQLLKGKKDFPQRQDAQDLLKELGG